MPVLPLPAPLRLRPSSPFVGRSTELAALSALVPRASNESRRIALIGGEAGSGKSRLVREFAHKAAAEGVLVLYGSCDAVVPTPYRPFAEALGQLVRDIAADTLREDLGSAGGELSRLLPDLPTRISSLSAPIAADPETERHRLHTSVADLLMNAGRRQPLLLIIEDGHWADTPSLLLLRHLARSSTEARVLLVATFRDTEAEVPAELSEALADLRRMDDVLRLSLSGLSEDEVEIFLRRACSCETQPTPGLAGELRDLTGGNVFLLCELWRTLVETDALATRDGSLALKQPLGAMASPAGVREVVVQRLARLDVVTRKLVELAAVAGPEFELDLLRRATPPDWEPIDALEPAVRSGVIEELASPQLAYRFTHELVRRALYDGLSAARRAELHLMIAEAIEAGDRNDRSRALADLAHHFAAAAPLAGTERAIEYSLLAAQAASAALDYDEAEGRYGTALEIGIEDDRRRADTLIALGTARFRAGRSLDALQAFRRASEIARSLCDGVFLSRAAVGYEATCWRPGLWDQGARELLVEASSSLDPQDSPLRVEVLSGLARALELEGEPSAADLVRQEAIAMARRIGDRRGLVTVLMGIYWARSTRGLPEILDALAEARDLAKGLGDIASQAEAMEWRVAALTALGEIPAAMTELAATQEMALDTRQPFILHVAEQYQSMLALLRGELVEAEAAAERSRGWGRLLVGRDASGVYGIQMFGVRREQGRLAELAPVIRVLAADNHGSGAWQPALAATLAELGMEVQLREQLDRIQASGLEPFRRTLWLASLTYLADAASAVSHQGVAAIVYPALAAHARTNLMIGHGVACYGSADRYLGMLAAALGDWDSASRHFERALEMNRRMGARTWLAHTAYQYGRGLLAIDSEQERAQALLAESAQLAEALGMAALLSRVRGLLAAPLPTLPDGLSPREVEVLRRAARGLSNREIGSSLFISEHTAANHMRSILRKTSCANRAEATAYAYEHGLAGG
ncbi:MAG TPA: AAA family ATPase [Solirubrobacteraceae bacterium]|nr:AAA family ATPase [Solirubrobacteraceae bacterium]